MKKQLSLLGASLAIILSAYSIQPAEAHHITDLLGRLGVSEPDEAVGQTEFEDKNDGGVDGGFGQGTTIAGSGPSGSTGCGDLCDNEDTDVINQLFPQE